MANKKETRWNLKALGEYARYFLIVKNAVDRVVREYTESLTERLNIDEESNQPDFAQLMAQCKNIKIARDKADELLSWYYSCYLAIVMNEKEPEVIKTPDDIQSEEVKAEYNPVEDDETWEKWKKDLEESIDAGKNTKEKGMIDNIRVNMEGNHKNMIDNLRVAIDGRRDLKNLHCKTIHNESLKETCDYTEEVKDEGTDEAGEETV